MCVYVYRLFSLLFSLVQIGAVGARGAPASLSLSLGLYVWLSVCLPVGSGISQLAHTSLSYSLSVILAIYVMAYTKTYSP